MRLATKCCVKRKDVEASKRVCEAWFSVALNVQEELYNTKLRQIADLIKAKGDATIY